MNGVREYIASCTFKRDLSHIEQNSINKYMDNCTFELRLIVHHQLHQTINNKIIKANGESFCFELVQHHISSTQYVDIFIFTDIVVLESI